MGGAPRIRQMPLRMWASSYPCVAALRRREWLAPVAARHHPVLVQAALEPAVVEYRPFRRRKPDQFRELRIPREDECRPSREALLPRVAQLGIELRQVLLLAQAHAVR